MSTSDKQTTLAAIPHRIQMIRGEKVLLDADLAALQKEIKSARLSLLLRREKPTYLTRLYDPGIMTLDLRTVCPTCDGWGVKNRDRVDGDLCEPCDASGLLVRNTLRKPVAKAARMPGAPRSTER